MAEKGAPYSAIIPAGGEALGITLAEIDIPDGEKAIELRRVDPLGRAAACGITPMSRIIAVNGEDCTSLDMPQLTQLLRSFGGAEISLTLEPHTMWKAARAGHQPKSTAKAFADWVITGPSRALTGTKAALVSKPTWNKSFGTAVRLLKAGAYAVPRDITAIRMLTDHAIPKIVLPKGVKLLTKYQLVPPQPHLPQGLLGEVYIPMPQIKQSLSPATSPSNSAASPSASASTTNASSSSSASVSPSSSNEEEDIRTGVAISMEESQVETKVDIPLETLCEKNGENCDPQIANNNNNNNNSNNSNNKVDGDNKNDDSSSSKSGEKDKVDDKGENGSSINDSSSAANVNNGNKGTTNNNNTSTNSSVEYSAIILYIHGGAFCCCGSVTHRGLLMDIALATGAKIFALDYRRPPKFPYPAARDDVVLLYKHLLEIGVPPGRIILAGDSAGGGLAVSALVQLRDQAIPLPAGAVLLSPWVQLGDFDRPSWKTNALVDYLPKDLAEYFANAYAGTFDLNDPGLSPIYADLRGLPPLLVEVGEGEVLLDQIRAFAGYAQAAGVEVHLTEAPEMVHVFQLLAVVACRKRCRQPFLSLQRIAAFVKDKVRGGA